MVTSLYVLARQILAGGVRVRPTSSNGIALIPSQSTGLVLVEDVTQRLPVIVADDEAGAVVLMSNGGAKWRRSSDI